MNQAFQDAVEGVRAIARGLEQEIVRMDGLATARRGEEHLLQVAKVNRSGFEKEMETVRTAVLEARRDLGDAQAEAERVLADAQRQATELVAAARGEANRLIGDARRKVASVHASLELAT